MKQTTRRSSPPANRCAVCWSAVDLTDGTTVRLVLARGLDEPASDPTTASSEIETDWRHSYAVSFCGMDHARSWAAEADVPQHAWVRSSPVSDRGLTLALLAVLLVLVLAGLGVADLVGTDL
ncbi:hypothetical protein ACOACO_12645 [Nocardioides sp. CPCC 205120]|uniref:hypothetical protein n=1 Tax=Nocardioides sp. CPCC 205120 TaxID=3406462 RepID=UPI003B50F396